MVCKDYLHAQILEPPVCGVTTNVLLHLRQLKSLTILRHSDLPSKSIAQMAGHGIGGIGLAVSDEHLARRRRHVREPAHNFFPIRVRGKAADLFYPATYRNPLAQDLHLLFAVSHAPAERARGLVTNKNYSGAFVGQESQRMMKYAAAIHHSRRRDNHARAFG